jgi:hypothetical protein
MVEHPAEATVAGMFGVKPSRTATFPPSRS